MATAALATVAVVGTVKSIENNRRAASAQRRANALTRQQNQIQNARRRREALRDARVAFGRAQNAAANGGVLDSSGSEGGLGSIVSQANSNLSFLDENTRLADQASKELGNVRQFQYKAQQAQGAANLSLSLLGQLQKAAGAAG